MKREELSELGLSAVAVDKIMALGGRDIEKHKTAANEWQQKYEVDTAQLRQKLGDVQYTNATEHATKGLRFSSESAKRAFENDLKNAALPFENGNLAGFDDFAAHYRENDSAAFACENAGKTPMLVMPTGNSTSLKAPNSALRAAFGLHTTI